MLCISKKTEYCLIALAHMAENPGAVASAREISKTNRLPQALLMNILKTLQSHGLLRSTRGINGGYQIARDLNSISLHELIAMVDCQGHSAEGDCGCMEQALSLGDFDDTYISEAHGPVQALQFTLLRFLKNVRVADLVLPGRRIDVPIEYLKFKETSKNRRLSHAHRTE